MNECSKCGKEFSDAEAAKVHAKFGTGYRQSDMCWRCADSWEPGDDYYERMAESLANAAERERQSLKDAGRLK